MLIVGCIFLFSLIFAVGCNTSSKEQQSEDVFVMQAGAQVVCDRPSAMKFTAELSGVELKEEDKLGFFIFSSEWLSEYEGDYVNIEQKSNLYVNEDSQRTENGITYIECLLSGIAPNDRAKSYVAIAYIRSADGTYRYAALADGAKGISLQQALSESYFSNEEKRAELLRNNPWLGTEKPLLFSGTEAFDKTAFSIETEKESLAFVVGGDCSLTAQPLYNGLLVDGALSLQWRSDNNDAVTVTQDNEVKIVGKGVGNASVGISLKTGNEEICKKNIAVSVVDDGYTVSLSGGEVLFESGVYSVDNLYAIMRDGYSNRFDLSKHLVVDIDGVPVDGYPAVVYQTSDDVIGSVDAFGVFTANRIGETTVTARLCDQVLECVMRVARAEIAVADSYEVALLDESATSNNIYRFLENGKITYENKEYNEILSKIELGENVIFSGNIAVAKGEKTDVAISFESFDSNRQADLGKKQIKIFTDKATWIADLWLYTQILDTKEDIQNWLNTSIKLSHLSDGAPDGYFVLGDNIRSEEYWDYVSYGRDTLGLDGKKVFSGDYEQGFSGVFDGRGYFIQRLNLIAEGSNSSAFVPTLTQSGVIQNVGFSDCRHTLMHEGESGGWGGFLTAYSAGTIRDVYIDVFVDGFGSGMGLSCWGALAAFVKETTQIKNIVVLIEKDDDVEFIYRDIWNATAIYKMFAAGYSACIENIFTISQSFTDITGEGCCPNNSAFFATVELMRGGDAVYGYKSIFFPLSGWAFDALGLPYFATLGSSPYMN